MKRMLLGIWIVAVFLYSNVSFGTGLFFNVSMTGPTLNISTTIPHHAYANAGIKLINSNFSLSGCTPQSNGYCLFSVSDTQPAMVAINAPGSINQPSMILCLNGKGPLSCQNYTINNPVARFAYVTQDSDSPPVLLCALDANGYISNCQDAGGNSVLGSAGPQGIVLNNAGTMAYITGFTNTPIVYQCSINSDGTFNTCSTTTVTTPSGYDAMYGKIALNPTNTIAYLGDDSNSGRVIACPIVNGIISGTCSDTGATNTSGGLAGISLNKAGTVAYLTSYSAPLVTVCSVNGATMSNCIAKTGSSSLAFSEPGSAVLNSTETILYVADYGSSAVYACNPTPNNTQFFSSCNQVATVQNAWGITLNKQNTLAYVANYFNSVFECPILANGSFGNCIDNTNFAAAVDVALSY